MKQTTDQIAEGATARLGASTAAVLVNVAEHFRTVNHADVLDGTSLLACVDAEALLVAEGAEPESAELTRLVLDAMPAMFTGITRGEAQLHIRGVVLAAGHEWTEDDNAKVIPTIPGPRKVPVPAKSAEQQGAGQSDAPTCCGRPMRRDGSQWVCGKCREWRDTGRAVLAWLRASDEEAMR
ncbi:hypothetical protein ACFWVB_02535 [Streptomyces microflavus]|uniref:hypothetical protein n=1 Tax=Streptomyces microflavus TaxID=1919 RepID=UPI003664A495